MPTHNLSPQSAAKKAQKVIALKPTNEKLEISDLRLDQGHTLTNDIDVDSLNMALYGSASAQLRQMITDAQIRRTIEGASTVDVTLLDRDRRILKSGRLAKGNDIKIDGLWFRICAVNKSDDSIRITFEDREVNVLREYQSVMKVGWGTLTRGQFVKRILDEPKEFTGQNKLRYVIEGVNDGPKIPVSKKDLPTATNKSYNKGLGLPKKVPSNLTVQGQTPTDDQRANINAVLDTGSSMLAIRKVLVIAVMTIIQESDAQNLMGGDRDSRGLFQQRLTGGMPYLPGMWPASRDPAIDSRAFFQNAIASVKANPTKDYAWICSDIQRDYTWGKPYQGRDYARWRVEAERWVSAYGVAGGDMPDDSANALANGSDPQFSLSGGGASQYEFTRGSPTLENGVTKWVPEDSWSCLQRLANEVGWRCFCVAGTIYFISEEKAFSMQPIDTISEDTEGVDNIDFQYDVGKHDAQVTIAARINRWDAPPGSTIMIGDMGPINGRWLVTDISRSLFDPAASVTCKKPRPKLPEPTQPGSSSAGFNAQTGVVSGSLRESIMNTAIKAAAEEKKQHYHYLQRRPMSDTLFGARAHSGIDCSEFATLVYKEAGAPDPNGFNYNGAGDTASLVAHGTWTTDPLPGDLVMYSNSSDKHVKPDHVAVFIGNGEVVEIGSDLGVRRTTVAGGSSHPLLGYITYNLTGEQRGAIAAGASSAGGTT